MASRSAQPRVCNGLGRLGQTFFTFFWPQDRSETLRSGLGMLLDRFSVQTIDWLCVTLLWASAPRRRPSSRLGLRVSIWLAEAATAANLKTSLAQFALPPCVSIPCPSRLPTTVADLNLSVSCLKRIRHPPLSHSPQAQL